MWVSRYVLVIFGYDERIYPRDNHKFSLCKFNVLISAIESFMEKVRSSLKAYIDKLVCRVVTPCRVVAS